jgi:hypothetical protein
MDSSQRVSPLRRVGRLRCLLYVLSLGISGLLTFSAFSRSIDQSVLDAYVHCIHFEKQQLPSPSGSYTATTARLDCPGGNPFYRTGGTIVTLRRSNLPLPDFLTGTNVCWYGDGQPKVVWKGDEILSITPRCRAESFYQGRLPSRWHNVRIEHAP